ncbi:MAG TPA: cytochrome c oxidase assembly protein [Croceibacterium sp.]|nr:cytochrome c oxidase assembly protein [Croceibacterium sp.]
MRRLIAAAAAALWAVPAGAHEGHEHTIGWTLSPEVTLPLVAVLALYLSGLMRLRGRAERGRRRLDAGAWRFLAGWLVLAAALVSPLHQAGEVSFTMHMIEHELIMLPGALLLVAARAGPVLLWGLPAAGRSLLAPAIRLPLWRQLGSPVVATALQALALVAWHMPALFDRALRAEGWHVAQHLSFVVTALLFWWAMVPRGRGSAGHFVSAMCLFVTSMIGGGVGALMALDSSPWYAGYAALGTTPFGLAPAEDQQLAGVIMWVPGGLFHLAAALVFLSLALRQPQKVSTTA